ncbi:MAG: plasmid pRiA4b ORF-3 family protein [Planctomycetes bacterium]|nr:plasmid pRiA4b ORF-3 family protein [Planctomycetota bacterium]
MMRIPANLGKGCTAYVLEITLAETKPPIRRVVCVANSITLSTLHRVIQAAMGWTNSHLHRFTKGDEDFGIPDEDFYCTDERKTKLSSVLRRPCESMIYEYDFGDSWIHKIKLLEVLPDYSRMLVPSVFAGERNCPPEDVGGIPGFEELLEMIKTGEAAKEEHPDADFNAADFNVDTANARLKAILKNRKLL